MGLLDAFADPQFRRDLGTNAKQLGQSASNVISEGVTMPIDALAWLLRRSRVPVPENPIGGSDWAKQMGLMADVPQGAPKVAGETLGLLAPMLGTKQGAAAAAKSLNKMVDNVAAPRTMNPQTGAIVWHGSPHKFDKFDASKIGTGEGAQAYGHGLYLAESPDVAKSYQTALSADRGFSFGGKTGLTRAEVQDMVNAKYGAGYLDGVLRPSGVADSFIDDMVTGLNRAEGLYPRQYKPGSQRAKVYDELRGQISHADPGALYKVDLPDEQIAKMLDWDKPLSQQASEVQAALNRAHPELKRKIFAQTNIGTEPKGAQIHQAFQDYYAAGRKNDTFSNASNYGSRDASAEMLDMGIPGIRYLDGGSRGAGQGSSNFVVFPGNENMLQILERNGQPLGLLK